MKPILGLAGTALLLFASLLQPSAQEVWLNWTREHATTVGRSAYVRGRVGPLFDGRLLKTERAYNYKLAATWTTPHVIQAAARLIQLNERLSDDSARALVAEAEIPGHTVVLVEIDPREGSGVIPEDWLAFLRPITGSTAGRTVAGRKSPNLRSVQALAGVMQRNYDYDRYWVAFPLRHEDGTDVLPADATYAELIVRIYDREGSVRWPISPALREAATSPESPMLKEPQ